MGAHGRLHAWRWLPLVALLAVLGCGSGAQSGGTDPKPAARSASANPSGAAAAPGPASGSAAGATAPAAGERLRVAWVSPSGGYLPLWAAQDAGLFRQRGLEPELT